MSRAFTPTRLPTRFLTRCPIVGLLSGRKASNFAPSHFPSAFWSNHTSQRAGLADRHSNRPPFAAACFAAACLVTTTLPCGCTTDRSRDQNAAVSIRTARMGEPGRYINRFDSTATPIVWARAGERLILAVEPTADQIASGELVARLDRGRSIPAPLYLIWTAPTTTNNHPQNKAASWLDGFPGTTPAGSSAAAWRSAPADRARELLSAPGPQSQFLRERATWIAVLEMPADGAGQGLWLASRRVPIGWLLDAPYQPESVEPESPIPSEAQAQLLATLEPALSSPLLRWRARQTLRNAGLTNWRTSGVIDDPILDRLARQIEDEWTFGLEWLRLAQPDLGVRVRARIAGLVVLAPSLDEPNAQATVVWDPDPAGLEIVKGSLLGTSESAANRIERVESWLRSEASTGAWVIDDAGQSNPSQVQSTATIGLVRLPGAEGPREAAAFGTWQGDDRPPGVFGLSAGRIASVSTQIGAAGVGVGSAHARRDAALLGIGPWRATRRVLDRSPEVRPPGIALGPAVQDWRLVTWWANAFSNPEGPLPGIGERGFSVLLTKSLRASGVDGAGRDSQQFERASDASWSLYVEAESLQSAAAGTSALGRDEVRIWIGAPYAARAVCTVRSDGTFEATGPASVGMRAEVRRWTPADAGVSGGPATTPVRQAGAHNAGGAKAESEPDSMEQAVGVRGAGSERWSAWITLPAACLDAAQTNRGLPTAESIRIGFERTEANGDRSSWPRPMTPWQLEPGRLRLDLSTWGGLENRTLLTRP